MSIPTENFASANFYRYKNSCESSASGGYKAANANTNANANVVASAASAAAAVEWTPTMAVAVASCASFDSNVVGGGGSGVGGGGFDDDDEPTTPHSSNSSHHLHDEKQPQHKYRKRIHERDKRKRVQRKLFDDSPSLATNNYNQEYHHHHQATAHQLISTCTQTQATATDCCEHCGSEKALVCLACKEHANANNNKNVDDNDDDAKSQSSAEFISRPCSKGDLLLQAIERTPKVAKLNKKSAKRSECGGVSIYTSPMTPSSTSLLAHLDSGYRVWKCRETQHSFTAYKMENSNDNCGVVTEKRDLTPPLMYLDSGYRAWQCRETQQRSFSATYTVEELEISAATTVTHEDNSSAYASPNGVSPARQLPHEEDDGAWTDNEKRSSTQHTNKNVEQNFVENYDDDDDDGDNDDDDGNDDDEEDSIEAVDDFDDDDDLNQNNESNAAYDISNANDESNVNIEFTTALEFHESVELLNDDDDVDDDDDDDALMSPSTSLSDLKVEPKLSSLTFDAGGRKPISTDATEEEFFVSSSKLTPHFVRMALSSEPTACSKQKQQLPYKPPPPLPPKPLRDNQGKSFGTLLSSTPNCVDCVEQQTFQQAPAINNFPTTHAALPAKITDPVFPLGIVALNRFKFEQAAMAANSTGQLNQHQHQHQHQHRLNKNNNSNNAKIVDIDATTPTMPTSFTTIFKRHSCNFLQHTNYSPVCSDEPQSSDGGCCSDCGPTAASSLPKCSVNSSSGVDTTNRI